MTVLRRGTLAALAVLSWMATVVWAQFPFDAFDLDHPAVAYRTTLPSDAVAALNAQLRRRERDLPFDSSSGYLPALLAALNVPVDSQMLVYSTTSLQGNRIRPDNPRAIYFNDSVAVAWVRGGFIEIASQDPRQGAIFYILPQQQSSGGGTPPQVLRDDDRCMRCHFTAVALGVPGFFVRSIPTSATGTPMPWLGNATPDHRTPIGERWAGWYVTGRSALPHLGNLLVAGGTVPDWSDRQTLASIEGKFDSAGYLSPHSDVVAMLVFNHQVRMMNLITRIGWEARAAVHDGRRTDVVLRDLAREVVDYMLFVDEAKLGAVTGSSTFARTFAGRGPRDSQGRSLRELDLNERLMRYPCSYMIYSPAFENLPAEAKTAIYQRLRHVLVGDDRSPQYSHLSAADRRAIIEILRDTKPDLSAYF